MGCGVSSDIERLRTLSQQVFVVVPKEGCSSIISDFCKAILLDVVDFDEAAEPNAEQRSAVQSLQKLLEMLPSPYTIVQEEYHVDKSFRDTYYTYFSNQHFTTHRHSRRLSFFCGEIGYDEFFSMAAEVQKSIQDSFMGSCVVNPLICGTIGRTLISPRWLECSPCYVRLSTFYLHVLGREFTVRAFPFRTQDEETMCCTEVTLLNLLEYYSNSYHDYSSVVPEDIINSEQKHSHERVLPSRGITYPILTKVLSDFGFSPRLYNKDAIEMFNLSHVSQEDELRRWLHYYVESGIPVAVNLLPISGIAPGHSIVCIGHGPMRPELVRKAIKQKHILWSSRSECHPIINSADFYEDYVVIDDNQPVYQVRNYQQMSIHSDMRVANLAVPLYKRMFLDAPDAYSIIMTLLQEKDYGINEWCSGFLEENEDVVARLFMASSKSFKVFRNKTIRDKYIREVYAAVPMPRFVWVCELYRKQEYLSHHFGAFGEVVIDATSASNKGHRSLIMMHYPGVIIMRYPDQIKAEFGDMSFFKNDSLIPGFTQNLDSI